MADPTEVDELDDEGQAPPRKNWRKELEAQAKAAEARAAELERKLAFSEAGLTGLTPKKEAALLAAHGDDPVTAEAFKATAAEIGFAGTVAETEQAGDPEQAQRDSEVSEMSRFNGAPQPQPGTTVMSQDEITAKIESFDSPEALKAWALANPDLFTTGAT